MRTLTRYVSDRICDSGALCGTHNVISEGEDACVLSPDMLATESVILEYYAERIM